MATNETIHARMNELLETESPISIFKLADTTKDANELIAIWLALSAMQARSKLIIKKYNLVVEKKQYKINRNLFD